jgi:hypothetical protein
MYFLREATRIFRISCARRDSNSVPLEYVRRVNLCRSVGQVISYYIYPSAIAAKYHTHIMQVYLTNHCSCCFSAVSDVVV